MEALWEVEFANGRLGFSNQLGLAGERPAAFYVFPGTWGDELNPA